MNRQSPELDPRLVAWLDEGPGTGPQVVLSNALAQARSIRQDRVWLDRYPFPTRFQMMSATITLAAVAVLALGVGVGISPRDPEVAAPAPSESPAPPPAPLRQTPLAPGDYTVAPFGGADWSPCGPAEEACPEAAVDDDIRFTFTIPEEGWAGEPFGSGIWLAGAQNSGPEGAGFAIGRGGWMWRDPCAETGDADMPVGPGVDEFVDGLVEHPLLDPTDPIDVTVGGYPGKYLELLGPADRTDCMYFQAWAPTFYAQGDSNHQPIWVIDVDGVRVVIHGSEFPDTDPERSAELRAIVESMRIEHDPALAPSPSPQDSVAEVIHGWPGARANPAGSYSWTPGGRGWMHGGGVEVSIAELDDEASGIPVEDITRFGEGLEGPFSVRPQQVADVRFQSWVMDALGTKVVIVMKSFADTAPSRVAEAEAVVDSIDVEPMDTDAGYRLVFELDDGWDSG